VAFVPGAGGLGCPAGDVKTGYDKGGNLSLTRWKLTGSKSSKPKPAPGCRAEPPAHAKDADFYLHDQRGTSRLAIDTVLFPFEAKQAVPKANLIETS